MKYLAKYPQWKIDKDYNIDKILYLLIDRPDVYDHDNSFYWHSRNYNMPTSFIEYTEYTLGFQLEDDRSGCGLSLGADGVYNIVPSQIEKRVKYQLLEMQTVSEGLDKSFPDDPEIDKEYFDRVICRILKTDYQGTNFWGVK